MDKFKSIFSGLEIAYGQYQPGERGDNGKQKGKAFIVRGQVTDELWSKPSCRKRTSPWNHPYHRR